MDHISRRLDEAASGVVPHLAPAVAVRARGEQRRRTARRGIAAGSAAVTVVVIATGAALAGTSGNERSRNIPLATPTGAGSPSAGPSASASPSPSSTASDQPSPPPLPPVSLPPTGPSETPPATPAPITELPAGFAFPEESSREWGLWIGEFTVTQTHELATGWALDPCRPTAYPTDSLRTDFYQARREGPEWVEVRQVGVYPSEADAHEVMEGFRRVLTACAQRVYDDPPYSLVQHDTANLSVADDGLISMASYYLTFDGPNWVPAVGGAYTAVVRVGNAVYLAHENGEGMPESLVHDESAISVRRAAARAAELLCDYNDSCQ